ncbi:MAG: glycosyltransferase [Solirubrobacteraceae bacterium]
MGPTQDGIATLTAPVAVRVLDVDQPLRDLHLSYAGRSQDYRSLLAIVRLAEDPIGVATFPVDCGRVTRAQLLGGVAAQLGPQLDDAYARRDLEGVAATSMNGSAGGLGADPSLCPSVSVVVPTCSNVGPLERCLRSILRSEYDDFEVIVVENRPRSSDTARMLVERFVGESRLRYVEEPRPSASLARNAGLASAEGEIVAFTDDDVVVDPLWLRASAAPLTGAPQVACVTGLILPLELESESQLLLEQFAGFGKGFEPKTYRLPEARETNPLLPYAAGCLGSGASIVMWTVVARELGGFDPALGPATLARGGEDLDLLARVLRNGYALSYDPRAIVWHEHPGGSARLRRQVYSYGIGLGAMLGKQLIACPRRRDFFRAIPTGVRYLRDPGSRKNVGKPTVYPRGLNRLERCGMLLGPALYVVSAIVARLLLRRTTMASSHPIRLVRRMIVGGQPVSVSWFQETDAPRIRFAWSVAERDYAGPPRWLAAGAAFTCVAASLLVAAGAPASVRLPFVLALLCLAPGIAWLTAVGGKAEPGLIVGLSLGLVALVAQSMLWLGVWAPRPALYATAAACLIPLLGRLARRESWLPHVAAVRVQPWDTGAIANAWHGIQDVLRRALAAAPARHVVVISLALCAWALSLTGANLNRMDGIGLLAAMPPTYFFAFALLIGGFAVAVTREDPDPRVLGGYVLALLVVIHATTAILYDEPRYAWTYPHLGVISLIGATGTANRAVDIYNNWPSFFALNAWFTKTSGVAAIQYAGWAQLCFNAINVFVMRFALRGVTRDERVLWTAALFFVLGNWVGQDYLAPQAFAFALSLVVFGLCLRCGRETTRPRLAPARWVASKATRIVSSVLPPRLPDERSAAAPLRPRAALVAGGICSVAIVTSHQLSPVMLIVGLLLLALVTRKVPLWVPAALAALELWWVVLAWPFLVAHFQLIDTGGAGAAAPDRNLVAALPGASISFYAPAAVMALMTGLGIAGFVRRLAQGRWDLVAACLVVAPVCVVAFQSYGGEGGYRAYLFALPWLSLLAAHACASRATRAGQMRLRIVPLFAAATAVGGCLLFAFFGQELTNRVPSNDVRAALWYEQHAPAGSMRIDLAPDAPGRLTARYPVVDLSDPSSLVTNAQFVGHRLGPRDVTRLIGLIKRQRARPAYVVLSALQESYARLEGLLPPGSLTGFVSALERSPRFRVVFHVPTVWIFEYSSTRKAGIRRAHPRSQVA